MLSHRKLKSGARAAGPWVRTRTVQPHRKYLAPDTLMRQLALANAQAGVSGFVPGQPTVDNTEPHGLNGAVARVLFVSEIFDSLQGEGPSQGKPCSFLRLAGCNLTCTWCDTDYSWNWRKYNVREEASTYAIEDLVERFSVVRRLVITGGEPLLQQRALAQLLTGLPGTVIVEIETNGTITPNAELLARVDQWNISPKLTHCGDPQDRRIVADALFAMKSTDRAWLKLVVADTTSDMVEVDWLVQATDWPKERVFLMPQCRTAHELQAATPELVDVCIQHGYSFTGRLHLQVWSGKRGH